MFPLLEVIGRSVAIYLFLIIAIRIFGKRELTQLSVIDLIFILLISNSVQNAMVGPDNSLAGGIAAAFSLFAVNRFLDYIFNKSKTLKQFIQGEPLMLIYKGHILRPHLKQANVSMDELEETVREHGVKDIAKVDLAILEADGNISVLSDNYQSHTMRKRQANK